MPLEAVDPSVRPSAPQGVIAHGPQDALSALMDSQDGVRRLMQRFEVLCTLPTLSGTVEGRTLRNRLVRRLCLEIAVQLQVEEELLFPCLREALDDPGLVNHAQSVQGRLRRWISEVLDRHFDHPVKPERVRAIALLFARHLRHEVFDVHTLALQTGLDWQDLGQRIRHRRDELLAAAVGPQDGPPRWPANRSH